MDYQNPLSQLTPRSTFLDKAISGSLQSGPSALAIFDYPHDSWKEAADVGGHAGSDAAVAEVIARLRAVLPPACAIAALGYRTFATMIPGPRFSDHRKVVVAAVKHVNGQPIEWNGPTLSAPRVVAAVVMSRAPETITAVGLVYEAASLVFSPAAALQPDRVLAWIYRDGNWHPFEQGRDT
jgi:GGDEF domain-containing protein